MGTSCMRGFMVTHKLPVQLMIALHDTMIVLSNATCIAATMGSSSMRGFMVMRTRPLSVTFSTPTYSKCVKHIFP